MKNYRVNYPLLGGLVVGVLVLTGASYGLWQYQMNRNAQSFRDRADEAKAAGDIEAAANFLAQYLGFRPTDDEVRAALADLYCDVAKQKMEEQRYMEVGGYLRAVENTLYKLPNLDKLRRKLLDMYMLTGQTSEAQDHVRILLGKSKSDPELLKFQALLLTQQSKEAEAVALYEQLVGYDPKAKAFDATKALAPNDPDVYSRYALVLVARLNDRKLATQVMDQLIAVNPELAMAYVARGRYRLMTSEDDAGRAAAQQDLEKARELDPKDAGVLAMLGEVLLREKKIDEARKLVAEGLESFPDNERMYTLAAELDLADENPDGAMVHIETGIAKVPADQSALLKLYKVDLLMRLQKLEEAKQVVQQVRNSAVGENPLIKRQLEYADARMLVIDSKWFEAAAALAAVRPKFSGVDQTLAQIDSMLGLCNESMGQYDFAKKSYTSAVSLDPTNEPAKAALVRLASVKPTTDVQNDEVSNQAFSRELGRVLRLPKEEQDWAAFDKYLEGYVEKINLPAASRDLLRAEVLVRRGEFAQAKELLTQVYAAHPEDINVQRAAVRLIASDPDQGATSALKLLDKAVTKFGDTPLLRLDRADLLMAIAGDDLSQRLFQLAENMDGWRVEQQVQLYKGLAERFYQLRRREDAEKCWLKVTELAPGDLLTRVRLFKLALESSDDEGMLEGQKRILDVVKVKTDTNYLFTEAARLLSRYQRKLEDKSVLERIDELTTKILESRPDWDEPHLLKADVAMVSGDVKGAMNNYGRGLKLGGNNPIAVINYVRLLMGEGQFFDAREALQPYDESVRLALFGTQYAELLLRTQSIDKAIEAADKLVEAGPEDVQRQLWYGQFMQTVAASADIDKKERDRAVAQAGEALNKVVELAPGLQQGWLAKITYLLAAKRFPDAEDTMRAMQLALPEDEQPLVLARSYELMGRAFDAENLYRDVYAKNPENLRGARLLAEFYLGNGYRRDDRVAKATPLVNDILRAADANKDLAGDANVQWARRIAARMLSSTGDYQSLLKAENLLASNSTDGALSPEDKLEMARILAPRPEPVSREKAITLLEGVREAQDLDQQTQLALASLYYLQGNWAKSSAEFNTLVTRYPESAVVRAQYIQRLLEHGGPGDIDVAVRQLAQLVKLSPDSAGTFELMARVAIKTNKQQEARAALQQMLPKDLANFDPQLGPLVLRVADLLVELGDSETAEKLYATMAQRFGQDPRFALAYAVFVGTHRDLDRSVAMFDELAKTLPMPAVIQGTLQVMRAKREAMGDKYDAKIQGWLDKLLREEPDSLEGKTMLADFRDQQRNYEAAAATYRELLANDDLQGPMRAVVINNLAYLLALGAAEEAESGEIEKLVDETVQILGPNSDVLDTRAVMHLAKKQFSEAVKDLSLAVTDKPTASKYFHKAQAHYGAGQNVEALNAWRRAIELGLTRENVGPLEQEEFDTLQAALDKLGKNAA